MLKLAISVNEQDNLVKLAYQRGNLLIAKGKLNLAEKQYHKVVALAKSGVSVNRDILSDVYHNLGMIAEENRNLEDAVNFYRASLHEKSERSMTWLFLARIYLERFDATKQLEDFHSGVRALVEAEGLKSDLPVVKYLKYKYKIA